MAEPKKTKEELLAARAEREAEAAKVQDAHETLILELEDRYSTTLGKRGVAFEIANEANMAEAGPIVVKLGEPVAHKTWMSKSPGTPEDMFAYVKPAVVFPDGNAFNELALSRAGILQEACAALMQLHGVNLENFRKKR
jgi:hypothetical protein